jgi:hypothetical protein
MSNEKEHEHETKGHEIIVNTATHPVHDADVSFNEVVELAYPGGTSNPDYIFRVDFEDAASKPDSGSLVQGGHTQVKKSGTEFVVVRSVRS